MTPYRTNAVEGEPDETVLDSGPNREGEIVDMVLDWLQTNVLKIVVVKIIPLIMASGVVVGVLAWAQNALGLDLDPAVVTAFVVTTMSGVIAAAFAYVKNHGGAAHVGGILLELVKLRELGQAQGLPPGDDVPPPSDGEPTVPPGIQS